jgi:hypothetical protein
VTDAARRVPKARAALAEDPCRHLSTFPERSFQVEAFTTEVLLSSSSSKVRVRASLPMSSTTQPRSFGTRMSVSVGTRSGFSAGGAKRYAKWWLSVVCVVARAMVSG